MATPAQMSANSTAMVVEEAPDDQRAPPHKVGAEWSSARRVFYHMAPSGAPPGPIQAAASPSATRPGELQRRQRAEELGMGPPHVQVGVLEQLVLIFAPDDIATPAADHSGDIECHLGLKTAPAGEFFRQASPFAASA